MMVALMLIATSFGVGYYMVTVYDIDLFWLSSDVSEWVVDSYLFFREIYPAAAGVVLIALFTYFVIASAVRRYKYYLDSGQDYRRMISLADTIDDLTNPAQIARLSDYPELQDVLRNYGDQISEISEGLESRESEMRSVDLEVEIDSILAGQGMNETLAEGNWWASIARKVKIWADENAGGTEELRKQSAAARQAAGRASLSCGKIIETAAGASEDILEIVKSAGELNAAAASLGSGGSGTVADAGSPSDAIAAIETAAATLEEKGSAIHDLSEESNGLALNIALMAARGEATEKDLAQLAEKVRSAAERFGKLGRELENLARTVAENSRNARSSSGTAVSDSGCASNMEGCGIKEISATIESRSRALQQKMMALGSDVEEINRSLKFEHEDSGDIESTDTGDDRIRATDGSIVNFGVGAEGSPDDSGMIEDSDLVIDHGKQWGVPDTASDSGMESEADTSTPSDDVSEEEVTDDSGESLISGFQDAMSTMKPDADRQQVEDIPAEDTVSQEMAPEETNEVVEEQVQAEEVPDVVDELFAGNPGAGENWDDMQAQADDRTKVEAEPAVESAPVDKSPAVEPEVVPDPEPSAQARSMDDSMPDANEEMIYDLFELGAVEYAENTEMNQ
jgi:methyl-accepting chemotaxis protein